MNNAHGSLPEEMQSLLRLLERLGTGNGREPRRRVLATVETAAGEQPIHSIVFGSEDPKAPTFLVVGGVHGLERIGASVALSYLYTLATLLPWDHTLHSALRRTRIALVPILNPGGLIAGRRSNPQGIDLMRNAPQAPGSQGSFLVGGHRISRRLPWFAGPEGAPMQPEARALCRFVEEEVFDAEVAIALDCHSGFGFRDRLWFPYARTASPYPHLPETFALKELLDETLPNHVYRFEPQADAYRIQGDLWDHLYDGYRAANPEGVFVPLTLEMGSWTWVRKNPKQLLSSLGGFNPIKTHRVRRTLRRHLPLFDFLLRAVASPGAWATPTPAHREALARAAAVAFARTPPPRITPETVRRRLQGAVSATSESQGNVDAAGLCRRGNLRGAAASQSGDVIAASPPLHRARLCFAQEAIMQKQRQAPRVQAVPFAASTRALAPSFYPRRPDQVPPGQLKTRRYTLRFANSPSDLNAVQRLRFEVFNLELHEGLESSFALGRDEDDFDAACHHLIVEHRESKAVVGTYRLMTAELAARRGGFYSAGEFDFRGLPEAIQSQGAETGRACVAAEHRSGRVIHLLWKGLARYLAWNNKRFLFGCASVPSTDPSVGLLLAKAFESEGHRHPEVHLEALPALRCEGPLTGDPGRVPPLLQSYLGLGAHIASAPALDRDFKVIDFLVLLDRNNLGPALTRSLFENCTWERTGAN